MDRIVFACANCGRKIGVSTDKAGKKGRCPGCGGPISVPSSVSEEPSVQSACGTPQLPSLQQERDTTAPPAERAGGQETSPPPLMSPPVSNAQQAARVPLRPTIRNEERLPVAIGAVCLVLLALSPLFRWMNAFGGGVLGIAGDGKIVLGASVTVGLVLGLTFVLNRGQKGAMLFAAAWGTVAVFWMGSLIFQVAGIPSSPALAENPFAGVLALSISPGAGLYIGLIAGLGTAIALCCGACRQTGHETFRKKYGPVIASQVVAIAVGVGLALLLGAASPTGGEGGPDALGDGQVGEAPNATDAETGLSGMFKEPELPSIVIGEERAFGQLSVKPLECTRCPISYARRDLFMDEYVRKHEAPVLVLALNVTNRSEGQVFAPVPSYDVPCEHGAVFDNYPFGSVNLVSGICQFPRWPAPGQTGSVGEKLKPGQSTVLVFVVDKLDNPSAVQFTWELKLFVDNQFESAEFRVTAK